MRQCGRWKITQLKLTVWSKEKSHLNSLCVNLGGATLRILMVVRGIGEVI